MKKKNSFCPKNNICLTLCFVPTALSFLLIGVMLLCNSYVGMIVFGIISFILLLLGLISIIYCIKSLNAPLVFFDEKIEQIKFGKKYIWYFKNMVDIKIKSGRATRYSSIPPLLIIIYSDTEHNLEIEMFSKCYHELLERCQTYPIYKKIDQKCVQGGRR